MEVSGGGFRPRVSPQEVWGELVVGEAAEGKKDGGVPAINRHGFNGKSSPSEKRNLWGGPLPKERKSWKRQKGKIFQIKERRKLPEKESRTPVKGKRPWGKDPSGGGVQHPGGKRQRKNILRIKEWDSKESVCLLQRKK